MVAAMCFILCWNLDNLYFKLTRDACKVVDASYACKVLELTFYLQEALHASGIMLRLSKLSMENGPLVG